VGIHRKLLERRMTLDDLDLLMDRVVGGVETAAGVNVTPDSAMSIMAVMCAVRIFSETVGSLPLHTYRSLDRGKEKALEHWLYPLLHDQPNPEQTSLEWRETMQAHLLLRGNAYSEIQRDGGGKVVALWPLHPDRVSVERQDPLGPLSYVILLPKSNQRIRLAKERVFHLRGLSSNGVTGFSPIFLAAQAIGLAAAAQEYGARLFKNDSRPGGYLRHPKTMSKVAYERLKTGWLEAHQGLTQAHRMAILEEGTEWQQVGINPDDAQFLESRKFSVTEVARMFNLPPHMLKDLDRATFTNIEHQGIEFVVYSLRPYLVRWEQRILMDLVPPQDRRTIFARFLVEGLLRGDIKSRYDAYRLAKGDGWLNANEIRELEDMNPIPEEQGGEDYWRPVNIGVIGQEPAIEQARPFPQPEPAHTEEQPA